MDKKLFDFNNYHDVNENINETSNTNLVVINEESSELDHEKNSIVNVEDHVTTNNIDNETLLRRDLIVYNLYSKRNLSNSEFIRHLASIIPVSTDIIMTDIASLKSVDTFKKHKVRVKQALILRGERKAALMIQGVKAINDAMDKSVKFDSDMLVNLSLRYECNPKQIVDEIIKYKKLSTQVALNKIKNHRLPVIRALVKCAKLNSRY
ncbi:hypothetical protein [Shewanella frigidimarina]|uniref:Uncharacterized protein n=1 Tax=Shewanella frigidimarina TaxID=56812 RepID=A0A119CYI3_SHEFR|nr:hypothetical protein [Shewanella frigidimarina]KVW99827.1 hypothetical protein AWJ07_11005 [Shewanella frigidimarina]